MIRRVATLILPENQIRRKPPCEAMASFCLKPTAHGGSRNGDPMTAHADDLKAIWAAYADGRLTDAQAQAAAEAAYGRRASGQGKDTGEPPKPPTGLLRALASPRREKVFGLGRPRALDRNAKVRIMHWARCLSRRTEKGKAYGQSPPKRSPSSKRSCGASTTPRAAFASRATRRSPRPPAAPARPSTRLSAH